VQHDARFMWNLLSGRLDLDGLMGKMRWSCNAFEIPKDFQSVVPFVFYIRGDGNYGSKDGKVLGMFD